MKKVVFLILWVAIVAGAPRFSEVSVQDTLIYKKLSPAKNAPFKKGEKLKYELGYGILGGGTAEIEVKDDDPEINGKSLYHIVGKGRSYKVWDLFFKVRDRYETFMDQETYNPRLFIRRVDEGGYIINQDYKFFQDKNIVKTQKGETHEVPDNVQDMLSAFYYARTYDFSNIKKGDVVTVQSFVDDEVYPLSIKYIGEENVKVEAGKFNCMKFVPIVQKGRIFKEEEDLLVWISNDDNKIPVKAEAKILIGSVTMELTEYHNLSN